MGNSLGKGCRLPLNFPSAVSERARVGPQHEALSPVRFEPRPFQRSRAPPCRLGGGGPPRPPHSVQHLSVMKTVSPSVLHGHLLRVGPGVKGEPAPA